MSKEASPRGASSGIFCRFYKYQVNFLFAFSTPFRSPNIDPWGWIFHFAKLDFSRRDASNKKNRVPIGRRQAVACIFDSCRMRFDKTTTERVWRGEARRSDGESDLTAGRAVQVGRWAVENCGFYSKFSIFQYGSWRHLFLENANCLPFSLIDSHSACAGHISYQSVDFYGNYRRR